MHKSSGNEVLVREVHHSSPDYFPCSLYVSDPAIIIYVSKEPQNIRKRTNVVQCAGTHPLPRIAVPVTEVIIPYFASEGGECIS